MGGKTRDGQDAANAVSYMALRATEEVRTPAILGVNGSDEQMAAAFAFVRDRCPGATLELLPYHRYGEGKYRRLGLTPPGGEFAAPAPAQLDHWRQMARDAGVEVVSFR